MVENIWNFDKIKQKILTSFYQNFGELKGRCPTTLYLGLHPTKLVTQDNYQ